MAAVISKIISMQSSLTTSENEIAHYVINSADEVISNTITTMAKKTQTSEASINRFCKKIGFKGFNTFKIALAQETFYNAMQEKTNMDPQGNGLIASVTHDYRRMLTETSALLDEDTLLQAAECMKKANCIYIFGCSVTACIAAELELKLSMIGLNAKAISDPNLAYMQVANIQKDDLAVVILPSILIRDIYQTITACKDRGVKIIAITSYDSKKLNDLVDYKFITSDRITVHNSISISNNFVYLYIVDLLYSALLNDDKGLRQKKLNSDAALNNNQMMDNYMLEY